MDETNVSKWVNQRHAGHCLARLLYPRKLP